MSSSNPKQKEKPMFSFNPPQPEKSTSYRKQPRNAKNDLKPKTGKRKKGKQKKRNNLNKII